MFCIKLSRSSVEYWRWYDYFKMLQKELFGKLIMYINKLILLVFILCFSTSSSMLNGKEITISFERSKKILKLISSFSQNHQKSTEDLIKKESDMVSLYNKMKGGYNKIKKGYSKLAEFDGFLAFMNKICIIENSLKNSVCKFSQTTGVGGYFYITGYFELEKYLLMIVSYESPERTLIIKWDNNYQAELIYDSFNPEPNPCHAIGNDPYDISPLRVVRKIEALTPNRLLLSESGNRDVEYKRDLALSFDSNQCNYEVIKVVDNFPNGWKSETRQNHSKQPENKAILSVATNKPASYSQ